jgi:isoleucyl-tRNA synthetase
MNEKHDYRATTQLPRTDFPMKANLAEREPQQLVRWAEMGLYDRLLAQAKQAPFVLHDGPPYANGHLHQGHLLNKVIKDLICKVALMQQRRSEFIPGWDCHGLPIEQAVEKELGSRKRELSKVAIRQACRAHADKFIAIQREEFQRMGIFGRWESPYVTMSFDYEAQIVRELARVVARGLVYRGKKPVYWCINDRTALAEAEIEYEDDPGPSVYVGFEVDEEPGRLLPQLAGKKLRLAIWTTTPWTLPANLAIAVNPTLTYLAYELRGVPTLVAQDLLIPFLSAVAPDEVHPQTRVVASGPIDTKALRFPQRILAYVEGKDLEGLRYRHPFMPRVSQVVLGDHVTLEAGTGLVHTAPGHGEDDYEVGLRYGLPVLAPVDDRGIFTADAGPFAGLQIFEANPKIEALLKESGALLNEPGEERVHSYPHCWRCKRPVIVRATDQWFISLAHGEKGGSLRERALEATERVEWIPAWGKERMRGMLTARPDWCISRQRVWGVPIPAFYCLGCGEATLDSAILAVVADRFEREGADSWFEHPAESLLPDGYRCARCGGSAFRKEEDILDVWFDSGTSQAAVLKKRLSWPADLYVEGSDQHRGWFHSSLLCALAAGERESPFKACLTHGFVVDGEGRKLSKSLRNYLEPQKLFRAHGADVLRLWAASENYRDDIRLSDEILARLSDTYRKVRNTLRYALANLYDFDPARDRVPPGALLPLDHYVLSRLQRFIDRVLRAYASYEFHLVTRSAIDLCSVELSAVYFDVLKDRLYCDEALGERRRAAQTVLHQIADTLCRTLAPVLSFTAEEAYGYVPGHAESVFLAGLPAIDASAIDERLETEMRRNLALREDVQRELERLRRDKVIGSSQEARVEVWPANGSPPVSATPSELSELFIVSEVEMLAGDPPAEAVVGEASGARLRVVKARGMRCDRCWNYRQDGREVDAGYLCARCNAVIGKQISH